MSYPHRSGPRIGVTRGLRLKMMDQERVIRFQEQVLKATARGGKPEEVAEQVCHLAENVVPNSVATVMLLDDDGALKVFSAPSVPPEAVERLNALRPGPCAGSCGTAVHLGKPVFVANTLTASEWEDIRDLAHDFEIKACWSMPVFGENDEVLGTFALSSFEHGQPSAFQRQVLSICASIVGITLERQRQVGKLKAGERRFRDLVETAPDWSWEVDADWRLTYASPQVRDVLGYLPEALVGRSLFDLLPKGRSGRADVLLQLKSAADGSFRAKEVRALHKDGGEVVLETSGVPVFGGDGGVIGYRGVARDVTTRRMLERSLEEGEARYRTLFEGTPDAILVHVRGTIRVANPAAARLFSAPGVDALLGRRVLDFVHPDFRDHVARRIGEVGDRRVSVPPLEEKLLRLDGGAFDAEVVAHPLNIGGEAASLVIIRDVSIRKAAEEASRLERGFADAVFDAVGSMIAVIDRQGAVVRLNRAATEFTGYSAEEARAPFFWKRFLPPEQMDKVEEVFRRALTADLPARYENEWVRRDGSRRLFDWTNSVVRGDDGRMEFLVTIGTDVTERRRAEALLRRSEEYYRGLFSHSKAAMLLMDPVDGTIVDANDAACAFYGYDIDSLRRLHISDINTQSPAELAAEMAAARDESRGYFVFRHRLADGDIRDVEVHSGPIEMERRTLLYSIIHDITDRRRLEEERRRLVMAIEQSPLSIVITAPDGTIEYVNPAFTVITGYAFDEAVGRNPRILKSGETTDEQYRAMWADLVAGRAWQGLMRNRRKDGSLYWEQTRISPVLDDVERVVGYLSIKEDVSARREVEAALKISEERFRATFEQAAVGFVHAAFDGKLLAVNQRFAEIVGYAPEELRRLTWVSITYPDDVAISHDAVERLITGKTETESWEKRFVRKDGRVVWTRLTVSVLHDGDGKPLHLITAVEDIDQRKAMEEELRRSNAELEEFAYVASHDLRQPLRMVNSYLGLIEKRIGAQLSDDVRAFFGYAVDGAKRMDRLITDLLQYSRIGRTSEHVPVCLEDAVRDALANLTVAIREAGAVVVADDGFPQVMGNPGELIRLFQNLVGNAVKYRSPDRQSKIAIGWRKDGNDVLVWVKDNGIGIAPKDYERAFMVFQRLVPKDSTEGTGIGLAVCKKIVEHHRGRIWIESEPGIGSTFMMRFPSPTPAQAARNSGDGEGCDGQATIP